MELNININLGISAEVSQLLGRYISSYEEDLATKKALAEQKETHVGSLREALAYIFKNGIASEAPATEEEAREPLSPVAPEAVPEKKSRKPRTKKADSVPEPEPMLAPELAPEPESPAPEPESPATIEAVVPEGNPALEESPWSLPFSPEYSAAGSTLERPEMTLDTARKVLADTRQNLQLEEGQEHFEKKRAFNAEVKGLLAYYGGDRLSALTPANLYWAAAQISAIKITSDGAIVIPDPFITPDQVELFKNAPFSK